MLTALWHSLINVAIVLAAFLMAVACFHYRHPGRDSILIFMLGLALYALEAVSGAFSGACALESGQSMLETALALDECAAPHSWGVVLAQVFVIGALLAWLALAWRAVLRRYLADEEAKG